MIESCDDYTIGKIATISMFGALVFLLFQLWVSIIYVAFADLLPSFGMYSEINANVIALTAMIICELALIIGIVFYIKRNYATFMVSSVETTCRNKPFIINEEYLERLFNIAAVLGIIFILMMKMPWSSVRIFLIVVDGFAVLYLIIFVITRLLLTHEFPARTLLSFLLSFGSLFLAIKGHQ